MIWILLLIPFLAGLAAFVLPWNGPRRMLLVGAAVAHAAATVVAWSRGPQEAMGGYLALDALGLYFLGITSLLFLAAACYAVGYLRRERAGAKDVEEGFLFSNGPEATFTACLLLFLATMTLVTMSQHLGILWVAIEATTLVSAPLIHFHRHHRSLEATWKYLLVCSVGIALALLGNFFLAVSASASGQTIAMTVQDLVAHAGGLSAEWLKAAFLLLVVGYGTKMGLAPMQTWLPDAHSEAPSVVSCLLSGALLNCAFLAILRVHSICLAAGLGAFSQSVLVLLGLVSMGLACIFIVAQADFKRMLAYSSVEHMGILALGVGVGGAGAFGALLHALNHSLTKAMLFLVAGNILAAYHTKSTGEVRGLLRSLPVTGLLWIAGFLAITGSPPFGPFLSELTILKAAIDAGHYAVAALYLGFLTIIFVGMSAVVLRMSHGLPKTQLDLPAHEPLLAILPPAALGVAVLILGVYVPPEVIRTIQQAVLSLGVR